MVDTPTLPGEKEIHELIGSLNQVDPSDPNTIPKFVDRVTIPLALHPREQVNETQYYEIEMKQVRHKMHRYFPYTIVWGYNGTYPGPTIETMRDQTVMVKWSNNLPKKHFLPVDRTLHGVLDTPEVRTVVHVHGAHVAPNSDGHPEAWFTKNFETRGSHFSTKIYKYTNHQQAATLWYHDHALGTTRLNVYAGLAGFYLIRDNLEPRLELPSGEYEVPLMIQDKSFNPDGSLFYPTEPATPVPGVYPSVVPAFIGNTIVVNGKVWPYHPVEPRKYRFRLVNGSNTRTYTLSLSTEQTFYQIGTDGGLLGSPVELKTLTLAPAERADIIIDFSAFAGQNIILRNADTNIHTSQIMQFKIVLPLKGKDTSKIPEVLYPIEHINHHLVNKVRYLTLSATTDMYNRPMLLLDGKMWHDPVSEKPELDTIEIWNFVNLTPFPHPVHVHLVQFQILDRQPFDVEHYNQTGEIVYTGDPVSPSENEMGWKDTVRSPGGQVTRIIAQFRHHTGDYVWHCHILEHEDHDMMRPIKVIGDSCSH